MSSTVIFGWHLDGGAYPETVTGKLCNLGDEVCGPARLLEVIEVSLGLGYPPVSPAVRAAQYLARLRHADDGMQFFSESFKTDPWATALYLLRRRDELVAAGWNGARSAGSSQRLAIISELESSDTTKLSPGPAVRLNEIIQALRHGARTNLRKINLVTPDEYLPPRWKELFRVLAASGVELEEMLAMPSATDGDLSSLQRILSGGGPKPLVGDGSLAILEADDELQAAAATAAWLNADTHGNASLVIIRGPGASMLDEACRAFGLPRPGGERSSRWRGTLQVLSLAFENMWAPMNPERLLEFLSLPQSPVPKSVSYFFREALREQPGSGGNAWRDAWRRAADRWLEKLLEQGLTTQEADKQLASDLRVWRLWLEPERFDPVDGMPVQKLEQHCGRVQKWAGGKAHAKAGTLFGDLVEHCSAFSQAVAESGLQRASRIQVQRLLDAIIDQGSKVSGSGAQAAPWSAVDHPGQIWGPAKAVLWWGFVSGDSSVPIAFWTDEEQTDLRSIGVNLEPAELRLLREAGSWRQALFNVSEQLILVKPRTTGAQPPRAHPFWHELRQVLDCTPLETRNRIRRQAHELLYCPAGSFARRQLKSSKITEVEPPGGRRYWDISGRKIPIPVKESFTSISRLLGCPLSWLLTSGIGLKSGVLLDLPDDQRLAGNLAHTVVAELFEERSWWEELPAAERAMQIFDRAVPAVAAPLLLPGRNLELSRFRNAIEHAIQSLVMLLNAARLEVVGCEATRSAPFERTIFEGTLDLLCRDEHGKLFVVDLKWTRSPAWRRRELREGRALQLAAYSWLTRPESAGEPEAGYFMLRTGRLFFSAREPFPKECYVEGTDLPAVWQRSTASYRFHMDMLQSGQAVAAGVSSPEHWETEAKQKHLGSLLELDAPCKFCEFKRICAIRETET